MNECHTLREITRPVNEGGGGEKGASPRFPRRMIFFLPKSYHTAFQSSSNTPDSHLTPAAGRSLIVRQNVCKATEHTQQKPTRRQNRGGGFSSVTPDATRETSFCGYSGCPSKTEIRLLGKVWCCLRSGLLDRRRSRRLDMCLWCSALPVSLLMPQSSSMTKGGGANSLRPEFDRISDRISGATPGPASLFSSHTTSTAAYRDELFSCSRAPNVRPLH